jgi:hypothetical protein
MCVWFADHPLANYLSIPRLMKLPLNTYNPGS